MLPELVRFPAGVGHNGRCSLLRLFFDLRRILTGLLQDGLGFFPGLLYPFVINNFRELLNL